MLLEIAPQVLPPHAYVLILFLIAITAMSVYLVWEKQVEKNERKRKGGTND